MLQNSDTEIPRKPLDPLRHTFADLVEFFGTLNHSVWSEHES